MADVVFGDRRSVEGLDGDEHGARKTDDHTDRICIRCKCPPWYRGASKLLSITNTLIVHHSVSTKAQYMNLR